MSKYIMNLLIILTCVALLAGCTGSVNPAPSTDNETTAAVDTTEDGFDYFYGPEESINTEDVPPENIEGEIPNVEIVDGSDSGYIDIPIDESADVDSEQEILDEYYNSGEGQP